MNNNEEFQMIATAVSNEGKTLIIWGQKLPDMVKALEVSLPQHFSMGWAVPASSGVLPLLPGTKCYALRGKRHVRAEVTVMMNSKIVVRAIDYGNTFSVQLEELMIGHPSDPKLMNRPLAEKYFASNIVLLRELNYFDKSQLRKEILGATINVVMTSQNQSGNNYAQMYINNTDLKNIVERLNLLDKGTANDEPERAVIWPHMDSMTPPATFTTPPPLTIPKRFSVVQPMDMDENPIICGYPKPMPLPVAATVEVIVTYAEEGLWSFYVQRLEDNNKVMEINDKLQKADKIILKSPIPLGQPCLAFCKTQRLYSRGIVVGTKGAKIRSNCIDYGCNHDVNANDIFEMPSWGIRTPPLAHQFILSKLDSVKFTEEVKKEMKQIFRELVTGKEMILKVGENEGGLCQYCELFVKKTLDNIKTCINQRMKVVRKEYLPCKWPAVQELVSAYVSHVESPELFYVQITEEPEELQTLIQEVAEKAKSIEKDEMQINAPCLALYVDGKWYRGRVLKVVGFNLEVFFVDYGNKHIVKSSDVKEISNKIVTQYPMLAIPCSLHGHDKYNAEKLNERIKQLNDQEVQIRGTVILESKLMVNVLKNNVDFFASCKNDDKPAFARQVEQNDSWNSNNVQDDLNETWRSHGRDDGFKNSSWRSNGDNRTPLKNRFNDDSGNNNVGRRNFGDNHKGFGERADYDKPKRDFRIENDGGFKRHDNPDRPKRDFGGENDGGFKRHDHADRPQRDFSDDGFKKSTRDGGFKNRGGENDGNKFGDGDRPRRQPIRNEDRVSPGENFPEQTFEPDQTANVSVTNFTSPVEFFVQTQDQKAEFTQMMNEMQTDYDNKFSFRKTDPPQESDIVIAVFSEDRILYRAIITEAEPPSVRFIDYGNVEQVRDSRNLYPVMKKYAEIPAQAIKCTLKGVQQIGGVWPSGLEQHFAKDDFKCTFHGENDGVYEVSLSHDGEDLANKLISLNLVASQDASSQAAEVASPEAVENAPSQRAEGAFEFEPLNRSLLQGQTLVATITYIDGVDSFFVQFIPEAVKKMEGLITEYIAKEKKSQLAVEDVKKDVLYLAPMGAEWYRCKTFDMSDNDKVWIQFIDYGDSIEIACSELIEIPENLKNIPALVEECCIDGDTSKVTDEEQDQFKAECELPEMIIHVNDVNEKMCKVVVYHANGEKNKVQNDINDAPVEAPIPTLPLITHYATVELVDLTELENVLIRRSDITQPEVEPFYQNVESNDNVEIGFACAVKINDGSWHRAQRLNETEALLVDSGKTEPFSMICSLVPELRLLPAVVAQVSITWPFVDESRVTVELKNGKLTIDPVEKIAFITHIDSANEFYVASYGVSTKWFDIALTELTPGELPADGIFAARFPEDDQWYRAELIDKETMTVKFIDFGNTCVVTDVAPLPPKLLQIPPLGHYVTLEGDLPEEALADLSLLETVSVIRNNKGNLDLYVDGQPLVAKLLGLPSLTVGQTVYVAHVTNPELVYLQREQDSSLLAQIATELNGGNLLPLKADPEEGQLVVAKYEDEGWYRARIQGDNVFFIDHGNSECRSELRELPEGFKNTPALAVPVALHLSPGCVWTDNATEILTELVDQEFKILEVAFNAGRYVVRLFEDDSDHGNVFIKAADVSEASTEPVIDNQDIMQEEELQSESIANGIINDILFSTAKDDEYVDLNAAICHETINMDNSISVAKCANADDETEKLPETTYIFENDNELNIVHVTVDDGIPDDSVTIPENIDRVADGMECLEVENPLEESVCNTTYESVSNSTYEQKIIEDDDTFTECEESATEEIEGEFQGDFTSAEGEEIETEEIEGEVQGNLTSEGEESETEEIEGEVQGDFTSAEGEESETEEIEVEVALAEGKESETEEIEVEVTLAEGKESKTEEIERKIQEDVTLAEGEESETEEIEGEVQGNLTSEGEESETEEIEVEITPAEGKESKTEVIEKIIQEDVTPAEGKEDKTEEIEKIIQEDVTPAEGKGDKTEEIEKIIQEDVTPAEGKEDKTEDIEKIIQEDVTPAEGEEDKTEEIEKIIQEDVTPAEGNESKTEEIERQIQGDVTPAKGEEIGTKKIERKIQGEVTSAEVKENGTKEIKKKIQGKVTPADGKENSTKIIKKIIKPKIIKKEVAAAKCKEIEKKSLDKKIGSERKKISNAGASSVVKPSTKTSSTD